MALVHFRWDGHQRHLVEHLTSTGVASLDRPGLGRLWDKVAERLQRNGLRPSGVLRLDGLDRADVHALAGLLGGRSWATG